MGKLTVAMGDADQTITAAQNTKESIRATGPEPLTDHRNLTLNAPAAAEDSYERTIHNGTSGGFDLIVRTSPTSRRVRIRPGTTSIVEVDENGVREIVGGFYDPRDFGAMFDGETDDLPALDAMIAAMSAAGAPKPNVRWPAGVAWISDRWVINRAVQLTFSGNLSESGLEVAHGKMGIVLEGSSTPYAQHGYISRPSIKSRHLVHPSATGDALGYGCSVFSASGRVRVGEVFVKAGGVDPTLCFRAISMTANGGRGRGEFGLSQPAWSSTPGDTINDNGITWRTEKIVAARQNDTTYSIGDRVLADRSNVYYFECAQEGDSASSPPAHMAGWRDQGTNILSVDYGKKVSRTSFRPQPYVQPYPLKDGDTLIVKVDGGADQTVTFNTASFANMAQALASEVAAVIDAALTGADALASGGYVTITSQSTSIDVVGGTACNALGFPAETVLDGTVRWSPKCAAGIYLHDVYTVVERPVIVGFMGPGIYAVGGVGYDADLGGGYVDGFKITGPAEIVYCGMGAFVSGDDANGFVIDGGFWGTNLGVLLPTPNEGDLAVRQANPGDYGGGHLLHEHSMAGGCVIGLYAQTSTGYPVLKNGLGLLTLVSCYSENGYSFGAWPNGGEITVLGGNLPFSDDSAFVVCMNLQRGRGITQRIPTADAPYTSREINLLMRAEPQSPATRANAKLYAFWAARSPGDPNQWGWIFNKEKVNGPTPAHWWALNHGNDTARNAFDLASVGTGLDPGAGWLCFENGYFIGYPGYDTILFDGHYNSINLNQLRGGRRKKGDRFRDRDEDVVVLEDATDPAAIPASAPSYHGNYSWAYLTSAQGDFPNAGWAGTRVEPAATFGKVNSKVFRRISGSTKGSSEPDWSSAIIAGDTINDNAGGGDIVWELLGYRPPLSRQSATTTTDAAGQKIAEFPIEPGGTTLLSCTIAANKSATADGFTAQLRASFKRNGTGDITAVGKEHRVLDKTAGLAVVDTPGLEGCYYSINNTTKRVEVHVNPNETVSLDYITRGKLHRVAS